MHTCLHSRLKGFDRSAALARQADLSRIRARSGPKVINSKPIANQLQASSQAVESSSRELERSKLFEESVVYLHVKIAKHMFIL